MTSTVLFGAQSASDISSLVGDYPLAWLVSGSGDDILATQVPLVADLSPDGTVVRLLGHFARRHPHVRPLQHDGRATALFSGPHGYISPSWFRYRTQAPTWNEATLKVQLRISIDDRPGCVDAVLARLVEHMERGRPRAWSLADMGMRYEQFRRGIVAFYGEVPAVDAKFKLGQNERSDVLVDQNAKTDAEGQGRSAYLSRETVRWLKRWLETAGINEGVIFRRLVGSDQIGGALNPGSVAPIFKGVAQWIGMPERYLKLVSGHSTRVGATQDLAALDIDLAAITQAGGWKSTRMPLQYAEKINAARSGMAKAAEKAGRDSIKE